MKAFKIFIGILILALTACIQPIKYLGTTYPATTSVDIYGSKDEIKRPYKVIGTLIIQKYQYDTMKKYLAKKAGRIGADAMIFAPEEKFALPNSVQRFKAEAVKYE